jgi:hypothetical protein
VPPRRRLLAWLGGVTALAVAVVALRVTDDPPSPNAPLRRYAADSVILPQPGDPPVAPRDVTVTSSPGRLRVSWTGDAHATGYEVSWQAPGGPSPTRLVVVPETQLDGLTDGRRYQIRVRTLDAFGQYSPTVTATGVPGRGDESWRAGLTGLFDDFTNPATVRAEAPGSLWHLSGYLPCDTRPPLDGNGLAVDLGCGADLTVVRARQPMRLLDIPGADGVLGRVVVVTDAAGPGGALDVDLTSGPADRIPAGRVLPAPMPDATIRVVINDAGAQVQSSAEVPGVVGRAGNPARAPARGPGVLHRFEILLTASGLRITQDGVLIGVDSVRPPWRQASVLIGLRGLEGRRVQVHLAAAGFTGAAVPSAPVVETPLAPATPKVLGATEPAPSGAFTEGLGSVRAARVITTLTTGPALDVDHVSVQLGDRLFPAHPVTPGLPTLPGPVTLSADIPVDLPTLSPFVVRGAGGPPGVSVLESYLELTPADGFAPRPPGPVRPIDPRRPTLDGTPNVDFTLGNASGEPLTSTLVAGGQLVLTVSLDPSIAQWSSTGISAVAGWALFLDGGIVASLPTGFAGHYVVSLGLGTLRRGPHVLEVREIGYPRTVSKLHDFDLR